MTRDDDAMRLLSYHALNEDEFEMEVQELLRREHPGPKLLRQMADILESQTLAMRQLAALWESESNRAS